MEGKAKCWKSTLTLQGLHKVTPPRRRYQQEALGGDGARSQCMAYGRQKRSRKAEAKRATDADIKQRRHERALALANRTNQQPEFACRYCGRKLAARIGQLSHERACARKR